MRKEKAGKLLMQSESYSLQRSILTGEWMSVPHYAGYKQHRKKAQAMATLKQLKEKGTIPPRTAKLGPKEKEAAADDRLIFDIHAVDHHPDGDNGPYWTVSAEVDGVPMAFDMQGHPARDPQMAAMKSMAAKEPITGCVLLKLTERMGNAFLVIESADEGEE